MPHYYTTLERARKELKAVNATDDAILLQYIRETSARINIYFQDSRFMQAPYFLPFIGTRKFPITTDDISSAYNRFTFGVPMLSLTSVSIGTTNITSNVTAYPQGVTPFYALEMDTARGWWQYCNPTNRRAVSYVDITGVWGWNMDYANAWLAVDTITTMGGINASVTSFTVADVDGANTYGITPRISAGDYLKVGDEVMLVTSTTILTNTVNVVRGVLGSTASVHAQADAVATYDQDDTISRVTARQSALMYARQGSFQTQVLDGAGVISTPQDLLSELRHVIYRYQYR